MGYTACQYGGAGASVDASFSDAFRAAFFLVRPPAFGICSVDAADSLASARRRPAVLLGWLAVLFYLGNAKSPATSRIRSLLVKKDMCE